jgi:predicted  nucleic acid-binding Zn-ribbon protein
VATELEALLALQADDVVIHGLEARLAALEPRIRELDARKARISEAMARTTGAVEAEEKKQAYLRDKIVEHKQLIEHNQAAMDAVKTLKQATAAAAQMDQAKKIVAGEESDLLALNRRLEELRAQLAGQKSELEKLEAEQEAARSEVSAERAQIDGEMKVARGKRADTAKAVPSGLLNKYDRIRGRKRVEAVFAMRGMSCGNCDTAIPMQRRHVMTSTATIDLCEACGVLMYFIIEQPAAPSV